MRYPARQVDDLRIRTRPVAAAMFVIGVSVVLLFPDTALAQSEGAALQAGMVSIAPEPLPLPAELVPQVDFWTRVYTEVDSSHGFLHDAHHLGVIYSIIEVPRGISRHAEKALLAPQSRAISDALIKLGHGQREALSAAEQQVLAAWPDGTPNDVLLQASHHVRYQAGQREKFLAGLLRARWWKPYIEQVVGEYHLPRELVALPHVESSFDMHAYSKAHAAGIWQFTTATGKRFMHIDQVIDERFEPIIATRAAAALLQENYRKVGTWPLAITAYNHGAEGMRRAARSVGSDDLPTIIRNYNSRNFGFASRNFYTELLAAWEVSQHPEKYFGSLQNLQAPRYLSVTCDAYYKASTLARAFELDVTVLRDHNPALRSAVWSGQKLVPKGYVLRLPEALVAESAREDLLARLESIPSEQRFASSDAASSKTLLASSPRPAARPAPGASRAAARAGNAASRAWAPPPLWLSDADAPSLSCEATSKTLFP